MSITKFHANNIVCFLDIFLLESHTIVSQLRLILSNHTYLTSAALVCPAERNEMGKGWGKLYSPVPSSRSIGFSEVGEAAFETFQLVLFDGIWEKILKRSQFIFLFALSVTETRLAM